MTKRRIRHMIRPDVSRLVGWTEKDEKDLRECCRHTEEFMEKFCASVGVKRLPIVSRDKSYVGVRHWRKEDDPLFPIDKPKTKEKKND